MDEPRERPRVGSKHTTAVGEPPQPRPVVRSPDAAVPATTMLAEDQKHRAGNVPALHEPTAVGDEDPDARQARRS